MSHDFRPGGARRCATSPHARSEVSHLRETPARPGERFGVLQGNARKSLESRPHCGDYSMRRTERQLWGADRCFAPLPSMAQGRTVACIAPVLSYTARLPEGCPDRRGRASVAAPSGAWVVHEVYSSLVLQTNVPLTGRHEMCYTSLQALRPAALQSGRAETTAASAGPNRKRCPRVTASPVGVTRLDDMPDKRRGRSSGPSSPARSGLARQASPALRSPPRTPRERAVGD